VICAIPFDCSSLPALTLMRLDRRLFHESGSLPRGRRTPLCQIADLIRDHRKAHPGLARPRRFHCRVQRQDIRLKGNLVSPFDGIYISVRLAGNFKVIR
jgi:hypothetical protein